MRTKILPLLLVAVALAHVPAAAADDLPYPVRCVLQYVEGGASGPLVCWGYVSCHGGCEPVDGPSILP